MKQKRPLIFLLAAIIVVGTLWSFLSLHAVANRTLDQRAQDVGSQLKCPVCQGESVADSPSLLAQQMRDTIRQQLQSDKSEAEVVQYFRTRYGDQIVWLPPWQGFSLLAWLAPLTLLLGGIILLGFILRDWMTASIGASKDDQVQTDEADLELYRAELESELATEDALFKDYGTEAR